MENKYNYCIIIFKLETLSYKNLCKCFKSEYENNNQIIMESLF